MSHSSERHDKNCLNCGTTVVGRFCHICGQENLEPKETFWHLVSHFFNDITHFDGKFFLTLKDLLFKPGFLPKEYMSGKRASYLNPVRMYVFTSAIFFLVFFSLLQDDKLMEATFNGKTISQVDKMDSVAFAQFTAQLDTNHHPMTRLQFENYFNQQMKGGIDIDGMGGQSKEAYDSALASGTRKDGWFMRKLIYKSIYLNHKFKNNSQELLNAMTHSMLHSLPQILFVSLPLFALLLRLLYVRRKQYYYVSHGIFGIHLYVFVFIGLLILFSLSKINSSAHFQVLNALSGFLIFGLFLYQYLAMKNFYRQGWVKTFFKFLFLDFLFGIVLVILFVSFIIFSFFKI